MKAYQHASLKRNKKKTVAIQNKSGFSLMVCSIDLDGFFSLNTQQAPKAIKNLSKPLINTSSRHIPLF